MRKVLIVDDDAAFRNGLAARLRACGFLTTFAADGMSAVQAARRECPDLILLDIGLPGGDGFVVMDRLRQLMSVAGIPIIVVSARPEETHRERALESGASAFLQKPIDGDQLVGTMINVLGMAA